MNKLTSPAAYDVSDFAEVLPVELHGWLVHVLEEEMDFPRKNVDYVMGRGYQHVTNYESWHVNTCGGNRVSGMRSYVWALRKSLEETLRNEYRVGLMDIVWLHFAQKRLAELTSN